MGKCHPLEMHLSWNCFILLKESFQRQNILEKATRSFSYEKLGPLFIVCLFWMQEYSQTFFPFFRKNFKGRDLYEYSATHFKCFLISHPRFSVKMNDKSVWKSVFVLREWVMTKAQFQRMLLTSWTKDFIKFECTK